MDLNKILKITPNAGCQTKCNKGARKEITDNDLCTDVQSVIDGLPIRCVGDWAVEKIFMLVQYFGIFSNGMKNKWAGFRAKSRYSDQQNLQRLGSLHFHFTSIRNYYDILFSTGHEKGIEFWKKAQAIRYDGQRKLF